MKEPKIRLKNPTKHFDLSSLKGKKKGKKK